MKSVSLKMARRIDTALAAAVGTAVNSVRKSSSQRFAAPGNALAFLAQKHSDALELARKLTDLRFEVRAAISAANESSGVNKLINQIAETEAKVNLLSALSGQLIAEVDTKGEYRTAHYVQFEPNLQKEITELKFQVSNLKDRTAGINAQATIDLNDSMVATLKELGIPL